MEETYQLIEGSPTLRDLDAENGFLWCPFGCIERQNDPGILISRLDDGSYDVRLGIGFDGPERFAAGGSDWSWMDMAMDFTVDLAFADDMELSDWISSETVATGAAWARCFNPDCGPADTLGVKEITAALKRFESPSYLARGPIADIEDLPLGYYWCPDAVDSDPSYNGYLLNVFSRSGHGGFPCTAFELFGGACDLLFGEAGQDFRATKDLDLVLLVEALTPEFGQVFWDFVKEGGYENRQKSGGKPQFYRFSKPEDPAFPAMLELFARTDVDLRDAESGLMPIHIDDEVSSLSAILLDEEYYRLLVENRTSAGGVAVLSVEGLIPFKAKAWLDLSARRAVTRWHLSSRSAALAPKREAGAMTLDTAVPSLGTFVLSSSASRRPVFP